MIDLITLVLSSAVVSALVSHFTARITTYSTDVVAERMKWRERIRQLTVEAANLVGKQQTDTPEFHSIAAEFQLRLNPNSCFDREILETLKKCIDEPFDENRQTLLTQVSRLLKHDWERAKSESRWFGFMSKPSEFAIRRSHASDS